MKTRLQVKLSVTEETSYRDFKSEGFKRSELLYSSWVHPSDEMLSFTSEERATTLNSYWQRTKRPTEFDGGVRIRNVDACRKWWRRTIVGAPKGVSKKTYFPPSTSPPSWTAAMLLGSCSGRLKCLPPPVRGWHYHLATEPVPPLPSRCIPCTA